MINWLINLFKKEKMKKFKEIDKHKLKSLFFPKTDVISLNPMRVHVIDEKYFLTNLENLNRFLYKDLTNFKTYLSEQSDCDDFAIQLWAKFKKLYPNFAFGFAISNTHAFNVFIDSNLKIWIVEPQTDEVINYKNVKSKYKIRMVII